MVYKLLIVILALLVLDTSTQSLNHFQDLYKYEFIKHHGKRQHDDDSDIIPEAKPLTRNYGGKTVNDPSGKPRPGETMNDLTKMKRAWAKLDLMNLLHYLPREEISEAVIFVPEEFEDEQKS